MTSARSSIRGVCAVHGLRAAVSFEEGEVRDPELIRPGRFEAPLDSAEPSTPHAFYPIGQALAAPTAILIGLHTTLWISGAIAAAAALTLITAPSLRSINIIDR